MRKNHFITSEQERKVEKLGIDIWQFYTVDEVIDAIRMKFNVIIYNTAPPHVDPVSKKIIYGFSVKVCNTKWGWNARKYLGQTKWRTNIYQAKREAIDIAINWILSQKSEKSKKPKIVAINGTKQKQQS